MTTASFNTYSTKTQNKIMSLKVSTWTVGPELRDPAGVLLWNNRNYRI